MSADDWMVVLPDSDSGAAVAAPLLATAQRLIRHASGRPWVLGCWPETEVSVTTAGTARMVLIGRCPTATSSLAGALGRMRRVADADALARRLPGCLHLLVSVAGQVRVQGTVAQARRVFRARLGGVTVAADRADVLARRAGADVDDSALAARLLFPLAPPPLAGQPLWQGVHAVPSDSYLRLDADGSAEVVRWWQPPAPEQPLPEAAEAVRAALEAAVHVRTDGGGPISADLSGGVDSTSLCFLVAGHGVPLVTFRQENVDPDNEDAGWAREAASALPGARHVVVGADGLPGKYADLDGGTDVEEPFPWIRSRADLAATARRMAETGARLHLGGHGGDEVFTVPPSYLHTLVRTHPWEAIRHLRGRRALRRWSTVAVARSLADRDDYPRWLHRQASSLSGPAPAPTTPDLSWGPPCRMPPWASEHALDLVSNAIRQTSSDLGPLAPLRAQHQVLQHAAICGRTVRQADRLFASAGTRLDAPYLDDRVIEAALAASLQHRGTPLRYKPLLSSAMAGRVPAPILARTTKGEFSAETYAGLRRHRAALVRATEDSLLAERDLIDPTALRRAITASMPTAQPLWLVDMTLAGEMWLRAQPGLAGTPARPGSDSRLTEEPTCP
jgi:asparagine synthase (glutamine-hydrolysing)